MISHLRKKAKHPASKPCLLAILLGVGLLVAGCIKIDPIVKYNLLTSIFDGVPELPNIEELCEDNMADLFNKYYEQRISEAATGDWEEEKQTVKEEGSRHRPWDEKNCQGCHNFQAQNKLHLPKDEICYLCHKNFIQGNFVHGPVAVGACLACHNPHSSDNPSLLVKSLEEICFKCHLEERLAAKMHEKIIANGMFCVDCHNPHSGKTRYFLK